jgi:hypothetical protein
VDVKRSTLPQGEPCDRILIAGRLEAASDEEKIEKDRKAGIPIKS